MDGKRLGQLAFVEALSTKGVRLDSIKKDVMALPQTPPSDAVSIFCKQAAAAAITSDTQGLHGSLCAAVDEMASLLESRERPPISYFGAALSEPFLVRLAQKLPALSAAGVLTEGVRSGPQALFAALAKRDDLPRSVAPLIDDYHTWLRRRKRSLLTKAL